MSTGAAVPVPMLAPVNFTLSTSTNPFVLEMDSPFVAPDTVCVMPVVLVIVMPPERSAAKSSTPSHQVCLTVTPAVASCKRSVAPLMRYQDQ